MIDRHEFFDSVHYFTVEASRDDWSDESDTMHTIRRLEEKGYSLEGDIMRIRLVRLDEDKEKELMIIYMEPLDQQGLSLKDFERTGGLSRWKEVSEELRNHALTCMKIEIK